MAHYSENSPPATIVGEGIPADKIEEVRNFLYGLGATCVRVGMQFEPPHTIEQNAKNDPPHSVPISQTSLAVIEERLKYPQHTASVAWDTLENNNDADTPFSILRLAHPDNPDALCPTKLHRAIHNTVAIYKANQDSLRRLVDLPYPIFTFLTHVDGLYSTAPLPQAQLETIASVNGVFVTANTLRNFTKELNINRNRVQQDFLTSWARRLALSVIDSPPPDGSYHLINGVYGSFGTDLRYVHALGIEAHRFIHCVDHITQGFDDQLHLPTHYILHQLRKATGNWIQKNDYSAPSNTYPQTY